MAQERRDVPQVVVKQPPGIACEPIGPRQQMPGLGQLVDGINGLGQIDPEIMSVDLDAELARPQPDGAEESLLNVFHG